MILHSNENRHFNLYLVPAELLSFKKILKKLNLSNKLNQSIGKPATVVFFIHLILKIYSETLWPLGEFN